jgi:hypothetical protein
MRCVTASHQISSLLAVLNIIALLLFYAESWRARIQRLRSVMQDRQLAYDRISQLPQELLSVTSLALSETDKTLIILHLGASRPLPLPFVGLPLPVHDLIPLVHTTDSAILSAPKQYQSLL